MVRLDLLLAVYSEQENDLNYILTSVSKTGILWSPDIH
jgi:hypothetical protein